MSGKLQPSAAQKIALFNGLGDAAGKAKSDPVDDAVGKPAEKVVVKEE